MNMGRVMCTTIGTVTWVHIQKLLSFKAKVVMNIEQNTQDAGRQTQIYSPVGKKEYTHDTNTSRTHKCT